MKSQLQIYTSFVSVKNLKRCTDLNLVPIFAMKKIFNSEIIGIYSGTALHFPELSPSNELYHNFIDNKIDFDSYIESYKEELVSDLDLNEIISKLEMLADLCEASGVVLMTYGRDARMSYRLALGEILNESDLLEKTVYEIG